MKKVIPLYEEFLNEASSLSSLGIDKKDIGYLQRKAFRAHDFSLNSLKSKVEAKNELKNGKNIIALRGKEIIAIENRDGTFYVHQVQKGTGDWNSVKSVTAALEYLTKGFKFWSLDDNEKYKYTAKKRERDERREESRFLSTFMTNASNKFLLKELEDLKAKCIKDLIPYLPNAKLGGFSQIPTKNGKYSCGRALSCIHYLNWYIDDFRNIKPIKYRDRRTIEIDSNYYRLQTLLTTFLPGDDVNSDDGEPDSTNQLKLRKLIAKMVSKWDWSDFYEHKHQHI